MPGIQIGYDVNDKTTNELGDNERLARIAAINAAWRYYDGDHRQPLTVEPGEPNENIILNYSGRIIDKTVEFMGVPKKIEVAVEATNGDAVSPQQVKLTQFWNNADLHEFVEDLEQSGSLAGHVFLRLIDDDMPGVLLLDPRMVTAFWNISNIKQTLFFRLQWQVAKKHMRQDFVPNWLLAGGKRAEDSADPNWTIIEYERPDNRRMWQEVTSDSWDYPFAPIVEWKNRRRAHQWYGVSDLRDGGLNDSINFIASNTGRIIKFHAHPKTVGTGFTAEQLEATSVDSFWAVPDKDATVKNLEMQSDLSSSLTFLNKLEMSFFAQHRVMDISSIKDKLGQITNFGVRMIFSDMLDMIDSKREAYGKGLAETSRRALALMGIQESAAPIVEWDDPLPVNRLEQLQAAEKEAALKTASTETLATELGRNYKVEEDKLAQEASKDSARQMNNVVALQQLGGM